MNLTIDLSEQNAAQLEAEARAAHMPADRYLAQTVAHALKSRHKSKVQRLEKHLEYMAAQVVPGTTADEMETALQDALHHVQQRSWQPSFHPRVWPVIFF